LGSEQRAPQVPESWGRVMGKRIYSDIEIDGVVYPDAATAAQAIGVTSGHVLTALRKGRLGGLGTRPALRPVTIRGVTYPNFSDAAHAHGVHPNTVRTAYRNGTLHRVGTGRVGPEPLPVRIGGKNFDNARAAAAHFKVPIGTIYDAICDGDPDRIFRPKVYNPWKSKPFTIGNLTFPSMREASRELGFKNDEYIAKVLKRNSRKGKERILAAAMAYVAQGKHAGGSARSARPSVPAPVSAPVSARHGAMAL